MIKRAAKRAGFPKNQGLVGSLHELRTSLAEADKAYESAETGEQERTAILGALRSMLEFCRSMLPSIESRALTRHYENFADLGIGLTHRTFRKSSRHTLVKSADERARDALIAVAFWVVAEGGPRKGNLSRDEAGLFIAGQLNRAKVRDRGGDRFTANEVINIYLEVTRKPRAAKPESKGASASAMVSAIAHDRMAAISHTMFRDQIDRMKSWSSACEGNGELPEPFRTIASRKQFARSLIEKIPRMLGHPGGQ